jgi:raffinose/stachyose/melibiose transport system permease protein
MRKNVLKITANVLLFLLALLYLYPLILVIINSMKTFQEVMSNVVSLPSRISLDNYVKAFKLMEYPSLFLNTFIVTAVGVAGVVIISSMAGYKLSRTKTRYSWLIFILCIAPMMIPFHSFMISLVKMARLLHVINSTWGLGVIYWGLGAPLALFMFHGFVKTIPKELDECAIIDGCTPLRAFFNIIFPLLKSVTVSVVVINAMWMWNDFLLPLLMLNGNQKSKTLQIAAYGFFGQYKIEWHYAMAGVLMVIIPPVILFIALQKYIIKGMVAGAIKT